MNPILAKKYDRFPIIHLRDRAWPSRIIVAPPIWCSVDLRDGNQALPVPMNVSQKLEMFDALVKCGFKEIEVGFPAASNTEFAFLRHLIEGGRIPDDVTIQVLVQARPDLITRTIDSLRGVKRAIIHLYNSTSPAQRRIVFGLEKPEIIDIARQGTQWILDGLKDLPDSEITVQYSPESFSATELDFSLEICQAVMSLVKPTPQKKMILNLPETVQVAMPNVYADQIESFIRNLPNRESVIISVHTHNDRGTGVASSELALLAGADRVEGTLFGNGERTGNLDIVTMALNLYTQGIDPGLDFSDLNELRKVYERSTGMLVPVRQPYSGELVFTAFSGSHQDAVRKGLAYRAQCGEGSPWVVPYLTIDPRDLGRNYTEVIRVNSQSGKGGVAYLLENDFGLRLPKEMQREFGQIANPQVDQLGREVKAHELKAMFWREYVEREEPWKLDTRGGVFHRGKKIEMNGKGNGPVDSFVHSLIESGVSRFEILDFHEHSLSAGEAAAAIAYVQIKLPDDSTFWGAGVDTSIETASFKAVLSALNRGVQR